MIPLTGYYGKIPAAGDFVSRGLPQSFIQPWDQWLQHSLWFLQTCPDLDWSRRYPLLEPVCFAMDAGVCGDVAWIGVLCPSQDRIGRRFPLTLCRQLDRRRTDRDLWEREGAWFGEAAGLAEALRDGRETLQALVLTPVSSKGWGWFWGGRHVSWWRCGHDREPVRVSGLPDTGMLARWVGRLAD